MSVVRFDTWKMWNLYAISRYYHILMFLEGIKNKCNFRIVDFVKKYWLVLVISKYFFIFFKKLWFMSWYMVWVHLQILLFCIFLTYFTIFFLIIYKLIIILWKFIFLKKVIICRSHSVKNHKFDVKMSKDFFFIGNF